MRSSHIAVIISVLCSAIPAQTIKESHADEALLEKYHPTRAHKTSGLILKKGDRLAALRDADEAVNLDPKDATNYANRAAVMRALSRNDDAIADLRKGLTLNPNETRKKQIETGLQELGAAP